MTLAISTLTFTHRAWCVPSEGCVFSGWLEGRPTDAQREAAIARVRQQRAAWRPSAQAWDQLVQLQAFVGQRVTIQFWDHTMWLLAVEDWPCPVEAHCEAVVTLIDLGHLQAFLVLRDLAEVKTGGSSGLAYLVERALITCKLAPVADLYEIEVLQAAS